MTRLFFGAISALTIAAALYYWAYQSGYDTAKTEHELKLSEVISANQDQIIKQAQAYSSVVMDWKSKLDAANAAPPERVFIETNPTCPDSVPTADYRQLAARYDAARTTYRECSHRLRAWQELHREQE